MAEAAITKPATPRSFRQSLQKKKKTIPARVSLFVMFISNVS